MEAVSYVNWLTRAHADCTPSLPYGPLSPIISSRMDHQQIWRILRSLLADTEFAEDCVEYVLTSDLARDRAQGFGGERNI